jgi:hypothetical protein
MPVFAPRRWSDSQLLASPSRSSAWFRWRSATLLEAACWSAWSIGSSTCARTGSKVERPSIARTLSQSSPVELVPALDAYVVRPADNPTTTKMIGG